MSSSRDSSRPRDWTHVSLCLLRWPTGSLPLVPPGKPTATILQLKYRESKSGVWGEKGMEEICSRSPNTILRVDIKLTSSQITPCLWPFNYSLVPMGQSSRFFFFLPHWAACGISVPQAQIEPMPPAVEAQGLNCWTVREVLISWSGPYLPLQVLFSPSSMYYIPTTTNC